MTDSLVRRLENSIAETLSTSEQSEYLNELVMGIISVKVVMLFRNYRARLAQTVQITIKSSKSNIIKLC